MNVEESRKMIAQRQKIATVVVIILGIALIGGIWLWVFWPASEIAVPFDNTIEKMAAQRGMPVIGAAALENRFVEGRGLGGAGGMGTAVIIAKNPENFFEVIGEKSAIIVYAYEIDNSQTPQRAIKKYWALSSAPVINEFPNAYWAPNWFYGVKEFTSQAIIFEKSIDRISFPAFIVTIVVGVIYFLLSESLRDFIADLIPIRPQKTKTKS